MFAVPDSAGGGLGRGGLGRARTVSIRGLLSYFSEMIKVPPGALELTTPPGALKLIVLPELGAHELKFPRKYEA